MAYSGEKISLPKNAHKQVAMNSDCYTCLTISITTLAAKRMLFMTFLVYLGRIFTFYIKDIQR